MSERYREQARSHIGSVVCQLLRFTTAANQIVGGDPVHQAFLTFYVKRQHVIAVKRTFGTRLKLQTVDLIGPTEAYVDFLAAVVGVAPEHFGLAVAGPGGPVVRR